MIVRRHLFVFDGDGTSDRVLVRLLQLLISDCAPDLLFDIEWVNPALTPSESLRVVDRLERTLELFPSAELILLHRDAERESSDVRWAEIQRGIEELSVRRNGASIPTTVPVVPVRMQETWLLVSERAIRFAVGRPRGNELLDLPAPNALEYLPEPKERLHAALRKASGVSGRKLKHFRPQQYALLVSEYIEDLGPLRLLPAFCMLERRIRSVLPSD